MNARATLGAAAVYAVFSACDPETVYTPAPNAAVSINVAPLKLSGVGRADYAISVSTPGGPVWSQAHIDSDRYGDGRGSISYVGPCDASAPAHTVTLVLNALYDENNEPIDADSYRNPTPISMPVTCLPNRDVPVNFDLVILRDAQQGFFDIAVSFDDLFCSAKLDCEDDEGNDLHLLHDGDKRGTTLVLAFACTAGPEADVDTWLYLDDIVVDCTNNTFDAEVDPSLGPGNVTPSGNSGGLLFGAGVYRGEEQLASKGYWNVALGLDTTKLAAAGTCRLTTRGTASDGPLTNNATRLGSTWPVITWDEQIVAGGRRVCDQNEVNVLGSAVQTVYSDPAIPQAFDHGFQRGSSTVVTPGLCGAACFVSAVEPATGVATTGGQVVLRGVFSPNDPTCAECDLQVVPGGASLPAVFDVSAGTVTFTAPAGATELTVALVVGLELIPLESLVVGNDGLLTTQTTTSIPVPRRAPTVTSVAGCLEDQGNVAASCATVGGESLSIVGTDFGPSAAGVSVTVGGVPCAGVVMVTPHTRLRCVSPAGSGFDQEVVVTVAGRPSSPSGSLSYFGPSIIDNFLSCDSGCTISGTSPVIATLQGNARIRFQTRFAGANASAITAAVGSGVVSFPCGGVAVESANDISQIQVLSCTVDAGAVGSDLRITVAVGGATSRPSNDRLSAPPPSIRPGTLRLGNGTPGTTVTGTLNGGDSITFEADHIGTRPELVAVNFGPSGGPYLQTCTAVTISGALVSCRTAPGSGDNYVFTLRVLDQTSVESTDTFNYPAQAVVDRVSGCPGDILERTVDCPTQGGPFLTFTGSGFMPDLRILVDGVPCPGTVVYSSSFAQCVLPAGAGDAILTFITGLVVSSTQSVLSYAAPMLTSVSGCTDLGATTYDCSTGGGTQLTLVGTNFGATGAHVTVGGAPCVGVSHDLTSPHTQLTCTLPVGAGMNQAVLVDNGRVSNTGRLSYAP
jgi:hypothetical protein